MRVPTPQRVWDDGRAVALARWYLRHADHVGPRVRLRGRARVRNDGKMHIADRVQLVSDVATLELVTGPDGVLDIEERTFINYGTSISASSRVTIGPRCQIGTYVIIMDNGFHRLEPERRLERPESAPVSIGENVWLGARVVVLPGVTIGRDSVIGAGSVVTRSIPPRTVAVGMPARVVREL